MSRKNLKKSCFLVSCTRNLNNFHKTWYLTACLSTIFSRKRRITNDSPFSVSGFKFYVSSGTRSSPFALWPLDFGLWTLALGLWTLAFGLWPLDFGLWPLDFLSTDLSTVAHGAKVEAGRKPLAKADGPWTGAAPSPCIPETRNPKLLVTRLPRYQPPPPPPPPPPPELPPPPKPEEDPGAVEAEEMADDMEDPSPEAKLPVFMLFQ